MMKNKLRSSVEKLWKAQIHGEDAWVETIITSSLNSYTALHSLQNALI